MKSFAMKGHGGLDQLGPAELPDPQITGRSQIRIKVEAAALNHLDLFTLGGLPGLNLSFPHILCGDGAGVVESVSDDVEHVDVGQPVLINPGISCNRCEFCHRGEQSLCTTYRVLGEHLPGMLAEFAVVPSESVVAVPRLAEGQKQLTWSEAAAFGLVTLTSWRMLINRARLQPGDTVLIWGIGGGVSSTSILISKLAGAFVIATSSSDEKLEVAREMGADVCLNHADADVAREVRKVTGKRGADVVIDNVGEATWKDSLRSLSKQGRLVTCGGTTGPHVVTDVRRLFWNQYDIMGSTMGSYAEFDRIVRILGQGRLRPRVDSVTPFDSAIEAFERMEIGGQMGKLVVDVAGRGRGEGFSRREGERARGRTVCHEPQASDEVIEHPEHCEG